jgi:transposase-like protein
MSEKKRKSFTSQHKAKVALDAIRGAKTLNEIAQEYTVHPTQVYTKYKESGLTRGEIRKKTAKPKAPIDLAFVDQFYDKLYTLDDTKLSAEQKVALNLNLEKFRSMAYQKMKVLKG